MNIEWAKADRPYEYYYGKTGGRFSVQIGLSSNPGKYVWSVFHDDFRYAVFGAEVADLDQAKHESLDWLTTNAKEGFTEVA
jgi:hypothetical protein